ncbi:NADP-dependent oxidoreductase domain [Sesbania bispinosa]|nr:NADP-dependent oxidoreductase domain [Sesbania bispinosa]
MEVKKIPEVTLNSGQKMPVIGLGTAAIPLPPHEAFISIFIDAFEVGYRHFDTASLYGNEEPLGKAVAKALDLGLIKSRDKEDLIPLDIKGTWEAMEECYRLGLAKSIGVSNFGIKKLTKFLENATIPPAVNQVEMSPSWQQGKLREFCKQKGIHIALRWVYEQGASVIVRSFNKERMKLNLEIFDWELSQEESQKFSQIPQCRMYSGTQFVSENGPYKSLEELWDGNP